MKPSAHVLNCTHCVMMILCSGEERMSATASADFNRLQQAFTGLHWPSLAFTGLHWPSLAFRYLPAVVDCMFLCAPTTRLCIRHNDMSFDDIPSHQRTRTCRRTDSEHKSSFRMQLH